MMILETMRFGSHISIPIALALFACVGCKPANEISASIQSGERAREQQPYNVIVNADQLTKARMAAWKSNHVNVALILSTISNHAQEKQAAESVLSAGLVLDYFVEVGRCPELAEMHPEWMASLQVHDGWRTLFPDAAIPTDRQVIKNSPWVPILNQEPFDAQVIRIRRLLADMPAPRRIWLNDVQGAPSACGCGHPLCRWTADYGPIKTATPLDHDAAARFVSSIQQIAGASEIIPVLVGECEADDKDTVCCGVACFEGRCWKDFTRQLDSVATVVDKIAVACFYQLFERDLERYGTEAGWIGYTLNSFSEMPRLREGTGVLPARLIAVLQGWDVDDSQIQAQIQQASTANVAEWIVALTPIDQSWQPVVFDLPPEQLESLPDAKNHEE
jgi:hypothetical protein